ncbi:MAG: NADH-quinone oxidoreductase subunit L [Candidatus Limnocylindrales bacterium]
MSLESLIPLLIVLPLAGFSVTALVGRRLGKQAHWIPVGAILVVWLIAMGLAYSVLSGAAPLLEGAEETHGFAVQLFQWIPAGDFVVDVGFVVDPLSACLLIVVTSVGLLVHIYSIGYMSHDPGYWRFFAYLNLFMVSMLLLVLADSWLVVFVAWELVGLSSYLLIGFWFRKRSAMLAAKKAFIVNRVGDVGFALGIMAIWVNSGAIDGAHTLNIRESIEKLLAQGDANPIPLMVTALLVFAGAMGKSAQFPLHVWLPDAMEGPTPVSALIHAATMVNAGVYLVARSNPLFAAAPQALVIIAAVGIFTAILAASIAMTQTDIKRVLAYSTLSQLGYMFAALGVGAWTAAIFHLMTHGFFKGLLFLGSGSVIHAVHEEQDMRQMGGLSKKIPITYATMLIGSVAISGIPPLAGFFSKDEILGEAFKLGFPWVWAIGIFVAILTGVLHVPADGPDVLGGVPRAGGDLGQDPRVAPDHDRPADHPGRPDGPPGPVPWAASRRQHDPWLAGAGLRAVGRTAPPDGGRVPTVRDRRCAHRRERGGRRGRHRGGDAPVRHRSRRPAPAGPSGTGPWTDRPGAVPLSSVAQQVVVRRAEPPAVHGRRRAHRARPVVVRSRGRGRHGQRCRAGHHRRGQGLRHVQTGRVQNYALGIALGLIVMAGSYLVLVGR